MEIRKYEEDIEGLFVAIKKRGFQRTPGQMLLGRRQARSMMLMVLCMRGHPSEKPTSRILRYIMSGRSKHNEIGLILGCVTHQIFIQDPQSD